MSRTELKEYILNNKLILVDKIMEEQMELMPELKEKYTDSMIEKSKSDTEYNLDYLAQSIYADDKKIFSNYYSWLYSVLSQRGIEKELLTKNLEAIKNVLEKEINTENFKILLSYLMAAEEKLKEDRTRYKSFIREDNEYQQQAQKYLDYLLNMQREEAVKFIVDLAEDKMEIADIYLNIFQIVQYEIGRLWQLNEISVAEEHYATSITQLAMSQLYPKIFSSYKKGKKVLTTCVGDELHELGIRMVADLLEINGWDTIHMGGNTPVSEIINILKDKDIDLLSVSVTLPFQFENAKELISKVKSDVELKNLKIMVGGRLFLQSDDLWKKIGADAFAKDAKDAVKVADSLL